MMRKTKIPTHILYVYAFIAAFVFTGFNAFAQLSAVGLTCQYRSNPDMIDAAKPRLSWKLVGDNQNVMQAAYEIRVGTDRDALKNGKRLVWKSKVKSDQSLYIEYAGEELKSRGRYYWQVRVTDTKGHTSPWSAVQYWQMGLLQPTDWQATWIKTAKVTDGKAGPAPVFRKEFSTSSALRSAKLYITSQGLYEATINGKRIGSHLFTPGWTSYTNRIQYQSYDVTSKIANGANAVCVTVGDGWFRGNLEFKGRRNVYGKEVALLFQLELEYSDGKKELILSNKSWKSSFDGPVRLSDIYNGETYDANKLQPAWFSAGYDDSKWENVAAADPYNGKLVAPAGPPVVKKEVFHAIKVFKTPKGELVADFGQNLVGWVQLSVKGKQGDTITVNHAEVLDKAGNFYTDNLRDARCENKYVLKGTGTEFFEPHFTFQGFRYARISGYRTEPVAADLTAVAIYSDMPKTGSFTCSNSLINQLQHNIEWGQNGNFLDVPTDCPQRDERLGWTGDAQVFFNTAAFNRDVSGFFAKWLGDLRADQLENGNVPVVIPNVRDKKFSGTAGWADAATIIPWNFYRAYGDKKQLETQYESMHAFVKFIEANAKGNLSALGSSYGDWLFYSLTDDRYGKSAITDRQLIVQAFYAYSVQLLINAANVLDKKDDAAHYSELLPRIKAAFVNEYVTSSGRLVSNSQTAYVLALQFDLLPETLRAQAAKRLADNVKEYDNHLTTGFIGTPYLCHVLSRFGYHDVAYKLLMQETYPSWLYPVKMGATTIWERWDGIKPDGSFQNITMNSFNHYSYGAIGDWMYRVTAGISQADEGAGYKKSIIAPKPGGKLTSAAAELETPYGKIKSAWKIGNGQMTMDVIIPANTSAEIVFPGSGGTTVNDGANVVAKGSGNKDASVTLGSGSYHFTYNYTEK